MSTCVATSLDVALLGCGNVGASFARLAAERADALPLRITGALVRSRTRQRGIPSTLPLSTEPSALLDAKPGIVVELLGGVEPARTLVLEALRRCIPVVTANKTLLARHGSELRRAAAQTRTPLLYEAAVLAGVPFLGTFARRPEAAAAHGLVGIVNGTTNFVLTRCARPGEDVNSALSEAQRLGYAEPDPRNDMAGIDAAEKLCVLLQHFAALDVHPDAVHTTGIDVLTVGQLADAPALGGVVKPVVFADWTTKLDAFVGPAFVPSTHVLARVDGIDNALIIHSRHGQLLFQGPGAGPQLTAATVLDDVSEVVAGTAVSPSAEINSADAGEPGTGWMITLDAARLPRTPEIADLLASSGLFAHRTAARSMHAGREQQSMLLWPAAAARVSEALRALERAAGLSAHALRTLERPA